MRVISPKKISGYIVRHPDAKVPLGNWLAKTKRADWSDLTDIKNTFNNVDYAGNKRYIFNIGGNRHRLVAIVLLMEKRVYVRFIGTHKEYEKIDCSKI